MGSRRVGLEARAVAGVAGARAGAAGAVGEVREAMLLLLLVLLVVVKPCQPSSVSMSLQVRVVPVRVAGLGAGVLGGAAAGQAVVGAGVGAVMGLGMPHRHHLPKQHSEGAARGRCTAGQAVLHVVQVYSSELGDACMLCARRRVRKGGDSDASW